MSVTIAQPPRVRPKASVNVVLGTLVKAFDGLPIPGQYRIVGDKRMPLSLASSDKINVTDAISNPMVPYLAWHLRDPGMTLKMDNWDRFTQKVTADIPAILKVHVNRDQEGSAQVRQAIDEVLYAALALDGLPVDDTGKPVFYGEATKHLFYGDSDALTRLVDRTGPRITQARVQDIPGDPYAVVHFSFHVEFLADMDRRVLTTAQVVSLGVVPNPVSYGGWQPGDPVRDGDFSHAGRFASPPPDLSVAGRPVATGIPIRATRSVEEPDPAKVLVSVAVSPYTITGGIASSAQLHAVANYLDGSTSDLTDSATWASSSNAVCTVSSVGLVSLVGAGSATVTATFLGTASNACAVTVT